MRKHDFIIILIIGILLCSCRSDFTNPISEVDNIDDSTATEIFIDIHREYQTIEGFGGFNTIQFEENNWNVTLQEKYDILAYDLGLTVLRHEIDPGFWEREDEPFNVHASVFGGHSIYSNFQDAKELHQRGIDKFIASVWSPPAWMKTNQSTTHGGKLKEEFYDKFAYFLIGYINAFKEETGIDLYGISIQNEPNLNVTWNSCIYSPEEYKNVLKIVGQKFKDNDIDIRLFGPEIFGTQNYLENWSENILNLDSSSTNAMDIFAIHIYNAQIAQQYFNTSGWQSLEEICQKYNLLLWQTETSMVYSQDWKGAMDLASTILLGLKYGKMSAWCWWALADREESKEFTLIINGKLGHRYYASKHFYRYIRPGAVHLKTDTEDSDIQAIAFNHKEEGTITVIIINKSDKEKKAIVKMDNIPDELKIYRSTESENCILLTLENIEFIKLKPSSITTLVYE